MARELGSDSVTLGRNLEEMLDEVLMLCCSRVGFNQALCAGVSRTVVPRCLSLGFPASCRAVTDHGIEM